MLGRRIVEDIVAVLNILIVDTRKPRRSICATQRRLEARATRHLTSNTPIGFTSRTLG
jgi:hypothetical protein